MGIAFEVEGQDLEKVNVITGVKGSGKSHLAKVILLQLIEHGAPCLVFDINREYIHLPKAEIDPRSGEDHPAGHRPPGSRGQLPPGGAAVRPGAADDAAPTLRPAGSIGLAL